MLSGRDLSATPAETGVSISATGNLTGTQLVSTVATGTAPLAVSSTTQVTNLNASQMGGLSSSAFAKVGSTNTFTGNQGVTGNVSATNQLISTVSTGTAPLSDNSTTQVANLNASLLGGLSAGSFAKLSSKYSPAIRRFKMACWLSILHRSPYPLWRQTSTRQACWCR